MKPPTILYVEDEADDIFFMRMAFERERIAVDFRSVSDGARAMAYLAGDPPYDQRSSPPLPTLVLLDLNLPLRSGFEVLEWLRRRAEFQQVPVVVFSSSGRPEDRARAQGLGATEYLLKPSSGLQFGSVARAVATHWQAKR